MLLTRTSAGEPQASIEVTGPKFTIGRAEDCDLILDDSRTTPSDIVRVGVVFLNIFDSEEIFAESDYRGWMTAAGLGDVERVKTPMGLSIMRGVKPAHA